MIKPLHIISLGAGVQSSTMALMFATGELMPMPDAAIFADTKAEPKKVYDYLDYLRSWLPFPIYTVCRDDGLTLSIEDGFLSAPFFAKTPSGASPLRRRCTLDFKIDPIVNKLRKMVHLKKGQRGGKKIRVIEYIGISLDEVYRMKPSRKSWIEHRWPLVDMKMTRHDCIRWIQSAGHQIPHRSACVYCPYHSNEEWRKLRDWDKEGWSEACRIDALIRNGVKHTKNKLFVHRSCVPLVDVDLSTEEDRGQINLFNNECEGMCGV